MDDAPAPAFSTIGGLPVGPLRWLLTILAVVFIAATLAVGFYIVNPCNIDAGPSAAARKTLIFPLRALVVSLVAGLLAAIACWGRARLAATGFVLVAVLATATTGFSIARMWPLAIEQNVAVSLISHFGMNKHASVLPSRVSRDVVYGHAADGTELALDVWPATTPTQNTRRPAFIRLHGGAWVHGAKSDLPNWNTWLNELGYVVFDVEYRMPPPVRWKEEIGDVKCALGWVVGNAEKYGIDASRISIMGYSAGANLAMLAAYSANSAALPPSCAAPRVQIKSVVNLYGFSDLALAHENSLSPTYLRDALRRYVGGPVSEFPDRYKLLSPTAYISAKAPPTITFLGLSDRIIAREQVERLDQALQLAGVSHETYMLPGADHGFDENWGAMSTEFARQMVKRFLEQYG